MSRLPDWEERLSAFIADNMDRPFQFGQWDCALFATACAAAITGEDRAAEYRGTYSDRAGSARALRQLGKGTLLRTLSDLYPPKPVAKAMRGDIVWFAGSAGVSCGAFGLFVGEERLADKAGVVMRAGLVQVPRALLTKAWAV